MQEIRASASRCAKQYLQSQDYVFAELYTCPTCWPNQLDTCLCGNKLCLIISFPKTPSLDKKVEKKIKRPAPPKKEDTLATDMERLKEKCTEEQCILLSDRKNLPALQKYLDSKKYTSRVVEYGKETVLHFAIKL